MMDTATTPLVNEGTRWLRRHLAWEHTMRDCAEVVVDGRTGDLAQPVADQSIVGTSAHSRSSS